ncbi:MAG: IclR family transcriptional regulator [Deltaproteobacteria bacterium]|nr:IclR family transcriptional regulator [Deltaproteobacteria bacterium]MBW2016699.1 IclR family transcriptional regulator [Deltaproteobacteria bacterium]MBW2128066.1 IclR family transcriptional regulator [Deltaproteobacteria bacterium]
MKSDFKRVPAVEKCFGILDVLSSSRNPMGISELAKNLNYNKSTVFNIVNTLTNLGVLERVEGNRFHFGTTLYLLGRAACNRSKLIQTVHPFLEKINEQTKLSAFLGIRSGLRAVILDKVDSAFDIRISSDIGMRLPLLAGAGGRALLSLLKDEEIDEILASGELKKFTDKSCVEKEEYKRQVIRVREEGIALDDEEYIDGIFAFAVPLRIPTNDLQAAIWAVGLKKLVPDQVISEYSEFLKQAAAEIESRFFIE